MIDTRFLATLALAMCGFTLSRATARNRSAKSPTGDLTVA